MTKAVIAIAVGAAMTLTTASRAAQNPTVGDERAVITILPAGPNAQDAQVSLQDLVLKVNGKKIAPTGLTPLRGDQDRTEIVILIDGSARSNLSLQFNDISRFASEIPANTKIALGYMENGRAVLESQLSSDPAHLTNALRIPAGAANQTAGPYFCLSDLAAHWPSSDSGARRIAILVTDGLDPAQWTHDQSSDAFSSNKTMHPIASYDPEDPYVEAAIKASVQARLQVYSIYWRNRGTADQAAPASNSGQSLISMVTAATGGYAYSEGDSNPVSFEPFFADLRRRMRNQYALSFPEPTVKKPGPVNFELKSGNRSAKIEAPKEVWIGESTESPK